MKNYGRVKEATSDDIREELARIIGVNEALEVILMLEHESCGDIPRYKLIPSGNPDEIVRDILNAEIALSMRDKVSKETVEISKSYLDTITRILLFVLRKHNHTLEEIEYELREIIRIFSGERIYIVNTKSYLAKKMPSRVEFLSKFYGMSNKEISKVISKSKEQSRRYHNEAEREPETIYREQYMAVGEVMKENREEILERQMNKIYVRPKNRSKTYNVEDLSKRKGEKGKLKKVKLEDIPKFE